MAAQDIYNSFMESLKNRMAVEGVTQVDLAKSVETSKTHFNTVLKGRKRAGAKLQKRLATYFGLSLEEMTQEGYNLLHGDQIPVRPKNREKTTSISEKRNYQFSNLSDRNLSDMAMEVATATKRIQDDLAKWQSIVEAIGDGVVVVSAKDQVIEYHNQAFQDLFGGNSIGKKCGEVADCPIKSDCPSRMAFETGKVCHGRFTVGDKTIALIASPIRDASGRIVKVVTTSRDVSERQNALADVLKAELRLSGVISLLAGPVLIFDEDSKLVFTNESVREKITANDEDLVNLETLIECLRPQIKDFDRVEMWMRKTSRSLKLEQTTVRYKSGHKTTWTSQPIFSPSGIYLGRVAMSTPHAE